MSRHVLLLAWIVMTPLSFGANVTDEETPKASVVLCDREYRIVSPDGGKELGKYVIKAVLIETDKKIAIDEHLSMDYRGKKAEYRSTVLYSIRPTLAPQSAAVETKVDGKVCMKGAVTFSEKTFTLEGKGFTDKRTGEALDPPMTFGKKGKPKPEGVLVFQSALPTIGPRILPKQGELKNIVFVEFPDDIGAPELINFKTGYRLVREAPDEKGEYAIKVYGPHSKDSISQARFNKEDRLVAMDAFGKVKLVPVELGARPPASPSIPASTPADPSALSELNEARLEALRGGLTKIGQARLEAIRDLEDTKVRTTLQKMSKGRREYFPVLSLAKAKGFQLSQGLRDRMHDSLGAMNGWGKLDRQEKVEVTKRIQRIYIDCFAELISNGLTADHIDRNQHKVQDLMRLFLMLGEAHPLGESRPTSPESGKHSQ